MKKQIRHQFSNLPFVHFSSSQSLIEGKSNNRPFPSSLVPLFQNESKCETFHDHMKMSSACSLIFMQIKVIFITMALHLDSLWNRGTRELFLPMNVVPHSTGNTNSGTRELTLKCKLKCYFKPMNNPLGVSPSKGKQGTTRGKEKIFWPRWESNPRPTD